MTFCNSFIPEIGRGREAGSWRIWSLEFRQDWGEVLSETLWRTSLNHPALCRFCQIFKMSLWARNSWMISLGTSEWMCWWGEISLQILLQLWQLTLLIVPFSPWEGHEVHLPLVQPWLWDCTSLWLRDVLSLCSALGRSLEAQQLLDVHQGCGQASEGTLSSYLQYSNDARAQIYCA